MLFRSEVRALLRQLDPPAAAAPAIAGLTNAAASAKLMTNAAPKSAATTTDSAPARPAVPAVAKPAAEPKPALARPIERAASNPTNAPSITNANATAKPVAALLPSEVVRVAETPPLQPARDVIPPSGPPVLSPAPVVSPTPEISAPASTTDDRAEQSALPI